MMAAARAETKLMQPLDRVRCIREIVLVAANDAVN